MRIAVFCLKRDFYGSRVEANSFRSCENFVLNEIVGKRDISGSSDGSGAVAGSSSRTIASGGSVAIFGEDGSGIIGSRVVVCDGDAGVVGIALRRTEELQHHGEVKENKREEKQIARGDETLRKRRRLITCLV